MFILFTGLFLSVLLAERKAAIGRRSREQFQLSESVSSAVSIEGLCHVAVAPPHANKHHHCDSKEICDHDGVCPEIRIPLPKTFGLSGLSG